MKGTIDQVQKILGKAGASIQKQKLVNQQKDTTGTSVPYPFQIHNPIV
jgi:hypothetical protein